MTAEVTISGPEHAIHEILMELQRRFGNDDRFAISTQRAMNDSDQSGVPGGHTIGLDELSGNNPEERTPTPSDLWNGA